MTNPVLYRDNVFKKEIRKNSTITIQKPHTRQENDRHKVARHEEQKDSKLGGKLNVFFSKGH